MDRIEKKEFFNDAVNNNIDLEPSIRDWAKRHVKAAKDGKELVPSVSFSLVDYHWILDLKHRVSMLRYFNVLMSA